MVAEQPLQIDRRCHIYFTCPCQIVTHVILLLKKIVSTNNIKVDFIKIF
jgi:hypothetical protein